MFTVGCVSFLNAAPLIDGIEEDGQVRLITDVPSRLLETLLKRSATIALCPTIDFQTAPQELSIVPVGAIGSEGTTMTVFWDHSHRLGLIDQLRPMRLHGSNGG
jgi:chorismate dehydratase